MLNESSIRSTLNVYHAGPYLHSNAHNNWHGKNVCNEFAELFYVFEGGIVFMIDNVSYLLPQNHLFCIPAGTTYTCWKMPGTPLNYIDFYFDSEWDGQEFFSQFYQKKEIMMLEIPPEHISQIFTNIQCFSVEPVPQKLYTCSQLAKLLLLIASTKWRKEQTEIYFGDILNFIQSHLSETISLSALAEFKEVCPAYFSKKFKEISGISHMHYLKQLRMWHAASLLKEKKMSIQEIASEVGFSNIYYFKNTFQKFFGIDPVNFADIFLEPPYINTRKPEIEV